MNRAFKFIGLICLFAAALILSAMLAIAEEFDGALAVTQQAPLGLRSRLLGLRQRLRRESKAQAI